jgi:glucose/arabinose dehydrogenase
MNHFRTAFALTALATVATVAAQTLPSGNGPATPGGVILEPTAVKFSESLLPKLKAPSGFKISVFAKDAGNVRMMQVMPNGDIYVTRRAQGDVLLLRDRNRDGIAEERRVVLSNLKLIHGITLRRNSNGSSTLYLATDRLVHTTDVRSDGSLTTPRIIIRDLPPGGQHPNRTLAFGPDGLLYITVGSLCNACDEKDPEVSTILRARPDGSAREVFAKGLRNTIGFGWHPTTRVLWGMDHGSDWRGDDQPPEELNRIDRGSNYGWPWCYADKQVDQYISGTPMGATKAAYCAGTTGAVRTYTAHSAPIGMVFYTATSGGASAFPTEYRNNAFVAMRGSWNRSQPSGYKVVRVRFDAQGQPTGIDDFITGWLLEPGSFPAADAAADTKSEQQQATRPGQFGRVAGLAVWNDGSLLLSEDTNGVIYRISYSGAR